MTLNFAHHIITLLPALGQQAVHGGKSHLAAVKEACKSAERIHGALKMAGRFEVAVVADVPDFFDPAPGMAKARSLAWETFRTTSRLQWVIPTRNPELICPALPPTWIGKGFQNVCLGFLVDGEDGFSEKLRALRNAPVQRRMILLSPSSPPIDLAGQLHGVDWVVFAGSPGDGSLAAAVEASCREGGVAYLFYHPDGGMESGQANDRPADDPPCPVHPFGTMVQLSQPTLPNLKPMSAANLALSGLPVGAETELEAIATHTISNEQAITEEPTASTESIHAETTAEPMTHEMEIPPLDEVQLVTNDHSSVILKTDRDDFEQLDQVIREGLHTFIQVGTALLAIRQRDLWRAGGHATWAAYCQTVGGLTKIHANRLIKAAEIAGHLIEVKPVGFTSAPCTPRSEWQIRPLYRLQGDEQRADAWFRAVERAGGQPTAEMIQEVVVEIMSDTVSTARSKPDRRQILVDTFARLRAAVAGKKGKRDVETLIDELEKLLKIK